MATLSRYALLISAVLGLVMGITACSTMYYGAMEKVGYHKRDILLSRVAKARDSQEEAKQQFKSALEQFQAITQHSGGKLEERYKQLKEEFDESEAKANAVNKRINDIEGVGEALFKEWRAELEQYTNASLRQGSERKLIATRQRYDQLVKAMRKSEAKIAPVLNTFRDQVLFLKHNLNAHAIASLQDDVRSVEVDVSALIKDMEAAIREANQFIQAESANLSQG
jgi:hypothetical protein